MLILTDAVLTVQQKFTSMINRDIGISRWDWTDIFYIKITSIITTTCHFHNMNFLQTPQLTKMLTRNSKLLVDLIQNHENDKSKWQSNANNAPRQKNFKLHNFRQIFSGDNNNINHLSIHTVCNNNITCI